MARAAKGDGSVFKGENGWRGYATINGRRRYVSGPTKTLTAQKLRELQNQHQNTGFVQSGRAPKLGDWISHWLTATGGKHALKTHAGYKRIVSDYLPSWIAAMPLSRIEPEHLEEVYADLSKRKLSGATVYQLHAVIRASLSLAVKRGRVPTNAAKLVVDPPKADPTKVEAFSNVELDRIYTALEPSRSKARWLLGLSVGPRPGEALGLEWHHIDFAEGSISVEQQIQKIENELRLVKYTKSEAGRRKMPMPGYVADALREHRGRQLADMDSPKWSEWRDRDEPHDIVHTFVFTSARRPGWPITPSGDAQQWSRLLSTAGLPHSKPYRARHTAASHMLAAGIDLAVVAEILGHANINVLIKTYAHALEERKRAAGGLLDAAFAMRSAHPPTERLLQ